MTNYEHRDKGFTEDRDLMLEQLVETYAKQITNFAYIYVKDWGLAEDITQDVFIKVFHNLETLRKKGSLKTWIYQIAANQCKDLLRKKYFKTTIVSDLIESLVSKKNTVTPEESVVRLSEEEALAQKVLALPIKYREVIILYYYHDLSTTEISKFLQIHIATVKSRLQRGRQRLKVLVTKESNYE